MIQKSTSLKCVTSLEPLLSTEKGPPYTCMVVLDGRQLTSCRQLWVDNPTLTSTLGPTSTLWAGTDLESRVLLETSQVLVGNRLREREFFIDNLLVRIHLIIEMILVDRPCAMGFGGWPSKGGRRARNLLVFGVLWGVERNP